MFDRDRFVEDCRAALADRVSEIAVKGVVARAVAEAAEVERALGTPRAGGLAVLYEGPALTVLNVVWAPGMAIYPHDHRMWAVIGLYGGTEDNTFYRRSPAGIVEAGGRRLETADVTVLGKDVIHAVANPSRVFTGALHVYGGNFFGTPRSEWSSGTREERPFDVETARRLFAQANERWQAACVGTSGSSQS